MYLETDARQPALTRTPLQLATQTASDSPHAGISSTIHPLRSAETESSATPSNATTTTLPISTDALLYAMSSRDSTAQQPTPQCAHQLVVTVSWHLPNFVMRGILTIMTDARPRVRLRLDGLVLDLLHQAALLFVGMG